MSSLLFRGEYSNPVAKVYTLLNENSPFFTFLVGMMHCRYRFIFNLADKAHEVFSDFRETKL